MTTKKKKVPMRKCVGCMESKPKRELVRIVAAADEPLRVDGTGKANGRGVYLCPKQECFLIARKRRAIGRSLDVTVSEEDLDRIGEELKAYEQEGV